jgi:ABC-type phosphate/phosphonate transport system ATPase subunit
MIDVRGLRKTYPGGVEAVGDTDFDVAPGEVFGLLGPDGAGKSTTVGMLRTTIAPTAGSGQRGRLRRGPAGTRRAPRERRRLPGAGGRPRAHLELHGRLWACPRPSSP